MIWKSLALNFNKKTIIRATFFCFLLVLGNVDFGLVDTIATFLLERRIVMMERTLVANIGIFVARVLFFHVLFECWSKGTLETANVKESISDEICQSTIVVCHPFKVSNASNTAS